jgi:hypothetical protein
MLKVKLKFLFLLCLATSGSSVSFGGSCQNVDLRPQLPPIRDQGKLGWCQSVVLAGLLSYHLQENLSPAAIGYQYSWVRFQENPQHWKEAFYLEGGSIEGAFESIRREPLLCRSTELPFDNPKEPMEQLKLFFTRLSKNPSIPWTVADDIALQSLFPSLRAEDFRDLAVESSAKDLFVNLARRACSQKMSVPPSLQLQRSRSDVRPLIGQLLDQRIPPAIFYDQNYLYHPQRPLAMPNHISLLVGRRWNIQRNRCEILLRNSHGPGCAYAKQFECEDGSLWIPEEAFAQLTRQVYWLGEQ